MEPELRVVDEAKTLEIFGQPGSSLIPRTPFQYLRSSKALPGSVGILRYKDKFYIDNWEVTYINNKKKAKKDQDLNVWSRENKQTTLLCSYHWIEDKEELPSPGWSAA
jgi:hypothetical protein